jgi:hypothetical protein
MSNLLLWNFSTASAAVDLTLEGLPKDMRVRHLVLDAQSPGSDENARLRPDPPTRWEKGDARLRVRLGPYAVHYWSLE